MSALPNDVARCSGFYLGGEVLAVECESCRRRTDPLAGERAAHMETPMLLHGPTCDYYIPPENGR